MFKNLLNDFLTFFVIVDPIGTLPIFLGLTSKLDEARRKDIARRAVSYAAVILVGFIVLGQFLLESMGVSLVSFKIAGGVILFLFGLQMIFGVGYHEPKPESEHDIAIFPLAVPAVAGPGAMLAVMVLTKGQSLSIFQQSIKAALLLGVLLVTYFILVKAKVIERVVGRTGINVAGRIIGILFAAIATETIMAGILAFKPAVVGG